MKVWMSVLISYRAPGVIAVRIDDAREAETGTPHDRFFSLADHARIDAAARLAVTLPYLDGKIQKHHVGAAIVVELGKV